MLVISAGFALGFLGSMPLAGPVAILVFRAAVEGKFRQGMGIAMGASIAEAIYCLMAVLGLSKLFETYSNLEGYSKIAGAIICLVLGIVFVMSKNIEPGLEAAVKHPGNRKRKGFLMGFSISALNPVLILSWSAGVAMLYSILGVFTMVERALFPLFVGLGIFTWFATSLWLFRRYRHNLLPGAMNILIKCSGCIMLALSLYMSVKAVQQFSF